MNDTRIMKDRAEMEGLVSTLQLDIEMFTDTGTSDRAMCNAIRLKMADLSKRWEKVTRDFTTALATEHRDEQRDLLSKALDLYKKTYAVAFKNAGAASSVLYNTMETERLDREAAAAGGGAGGGGGGTRTGAPPRVDESLRPDYKCSYSLSLSEFNKWMETGKAWGLASMHETRPTLVQKMYFEQICEKEFAENCNLEGNCRTFDHYMEESKLVYLKRVSIFLRRNEYIETTRQEDESYTSFYHRLRRCSEMADINTMEERDWNMHNLMASLPVNVFKQITAATINPTVEMVLATLEVVEQQMRQLGNTKFPLPPEKGKKKKSLTVNVASEDNRGRDRGGGGGNRGRGGGRGRGAGGRGGGQSSTYIDYTKLGCFRCGDSNHFRDQCEVMPSDCYCKTCEQTGHVDKVCLKKKRESANVSEEKKPEDKEKGEKPKEGKRELTPPAGGRDFSRPRGAANLVTVHYLDQENVHHKSALSSYELCNEAETGKGRLRRLACAIERKEKGGRRTDIGAVCDPGATASLLSKERADELSCNERDANGIVITTTNGAALDVSGQSELWLTTKSGHRKLVHVYVCNDLAHDLLLSADDCESLGLLPRNWPNHGGDDAKQYSKRYMANTVKTEAAEPEKEKEEAVEDEEDGRVDLSALRDALWSNTGDISKIPGFSKLPDTLQNIIREHKDVFSDSIGDRPMDCEPVKLIIDETVPLPPKVMTMRNVPLHWQSQAEKILTDLLQTGMVTRVRDPVPCVSPSFFVKKGDGSGDPRLVLDYKNTLNKILLRVPHPLPSQ